MEEVRVELVFGLGWAIEVRLRQYPQFFQSLEGSEFGRRGFFFGLNFRQPLVGVMAIDR